METNEIAANPEDKNKIRAWEPQDLWDIHLYRKDIL